MFDPKHLKSRQSPWSECLSHFPIKNDNAVLDKDEDNEVGRTQKK